jgi:hypothetical protein
MIIRTVQEGDIALCGRYSLGLITQSERKNITYPDKSKAAAYVGVHLTSRIAPAGSPWSSREPIVLSNINQLLLQPVSEEEKRRPVLAKCPHCRRRPQLIEARGQELTICIRPDEDDTINIPKYEVFPCCSARYIKENKGPNRLQRIRAEAADKEKTRVQR